jgi:hypothetical protein
MQLAFVPPHLGFPAANLVLELVVEGLVPVQRVGGVGRAAHPEMSEGVVVGLPVEVLQLQYDAVAVEDEGVERRRGSRRRRGRGGGHDQWGHAEKARGGDAGGRSVAEEGAGASGAGAGGGEDEGSGRHRS